MKRLEHRYEGPEVLARLLERSGCELSVDDVRDEFECAVEEGTRASELIPLLWELEPRFSNPSAARRTFANLFGLWDIIARDAVGELVMPEQDPDAPLGADLVKRAWHALYDLAPAELRRARDRFDNRQSDLAAFVNERLVTAGEVAQEAALDLAFECWFIAERIRGEGRLSHLGRAGLEAALASHDPAEAEPEPALAALITATLWERTADETRPLPEADIPAVERVLRAVRAALAVR